MREYITKKIIGGAMLAIGFFGTTILAVAISGTIKTWTTGEVLKSSDLNTTITSLKTAVEGIPNWTKSGTTAYYTDGSVGIGTSSPGSPLHISASNTGTLLMLERTSSQSGKYSFVVDTNQLYIINEVAGSTRVYVASDGKVGIGTTSPSHILHINGAGRSTQAAWDTSSDERLKDIKGSYQKGLSELMKLSPISFNYKNGNPLNLPSLDEKIGISAQSLQKAFPEAVKKQSDGYLTVNNDPVFWTMLNSIKELKKLSDSEKAANEKKLLALEEDNKRLREMLETHGRASLRLEDRLRAIENSQMAAQARK